MAMARIVKLAGLEFELLTDAEATKETIDCKHEWELSSRDVIINPGGEFVKGYGSGFVSVRIAHGRRCGKCGLFEAESEVDKYVQTNREKLGKYLQLKPARNKTICEDLRQLRKVVDKKYIPLVDSSLLKAKKMNDKLVEYAGKNYTASWYDENGNFIA